MIELSEELRQAVAEHPNEPIELVDSSTRQSYVLVRAEDYNRSTEAVYDDSPWTPDEMAILAAEVIGLDDDTDYSEYLRDTP